MGTYSSFPIANAKGSTSPFLSSVPGATASTSMGDRFARIIDVKSDFGATGDGTTDDTAAIQAALDAAFGTSGSPHGSALVTSNRPVFFPAGNYKITSALTLRSVRGARLFGAGRFATEIHNVTANGSVFVTNGFEYSSVEGMYLVSNGTGVCFDLDWDNTGPCALQSNRFTDVYCDGGAYGVRIGITGYMGSENLFQNCFFANHTVAGLATRNFNALQNTVIGGNCQACAIGLWAQSGSIPIIHGVGFQNQTTADIQVENTADDLYSVHGCRSENAAGSGVYFIVLHSGASAHVAACAQLAAAAGIFAYIEQSAGPGAGPGMLCIDSCFSKNGTITGNGHLYIRGNAGAAAFENAAYLGSFAGTVVQNI